MNIKKYLKSSMIMCLIAIFILSVVPNKVDAIEIENLNLINSKTEKNNNDKLVNLYLNSLQTSKNRNSIADIEVDKIEKYIENIKPDENINYDKELTRISESYEEGDILSEQDTKLIFENMKNKLSTEETMEKSTRAGYSSKSLGSISKSKYNTKVTLTGRMNQKIAVIAGTSSYGSDVKLTRNSGSIKKVSLYTYHTAYGGAGWNGKYPTIGVIYNGHVKNTKTSNLNTSQMNLSSKYTSVLPCYTSMYTKARVTTSKGDSYDVDSPTWSKFH